jgi:hypothetical protein
MPLEHIAADELLPEGLLLELLPLPVFVKRLLTMDMLPPLGMLEAVI